MRLAACYFIINYSKVTYDQYLMMYWMYWGSVLPSSNGYKRKNTISRKYCLKFMSILFMRGRDKFQVNMSKLLWKTNPIVHLAHNWFLCA